MLNDRREILSCACGVFVTILVAEGHEAFRREHNQHGLVIVHRERETGLPPHSNEDRPGNSNDFSRGIVAGIAGVSGTETRVSPVTIDPIRLYRPFDRR
jgi:hypothetical protein